MALPVSSELLSLSSQQLLLMLGAMCRGVCLLAEDSENVTECVPLCEVRGQGPLCTCVQEQFECLVCCNDTLTDSCTALPDMVPLSDHSPCSIGVCIDVSCSG